VWAHRCATLDIMSDAVQLHFGGLELLPELEPLWSVRHDHHVAIGAAGLAVVGNTARMTQCVTDIEHRGEIR
jgi:hypothetical protein